MTHTIKSFLSAILLGWLLMWLNSCGSEAVVDRAPAMISENLHQLAEAVASRDIQSLWILKDDADEFISANAWRALAATDIEDTRNLLDFALETDKMEPWFVLRNQDLSEPQIEQIRVQLFTSDQNRGPICEFLFSHGDRWTLDMLLNDYDLVLGQYECAMAVGGMLTRIDAGRENIKTVTELLFETEDEEVMSRLLYGFWRSELNRPLADTEEFAKLIQKLEMRRGRQPALVDEYLIRLTNERGFEIVMGSRSDSELSENIQFSVELARSVRHLNGERVNVGTIMRLLNHSNPHITVTTLESMMELDGLDSFWLKGLADELIHFPANAEVAVTYLELLQRNGVDFQNLISILELVDQNQPYLKNRTLRLFSELYHQDDYHEKIRNSLKEEGIESYHAAIALSDFVMKHVEQSDIRAETRELLIQALQSQNRSALTPSGQLLTNRTLFNEGDKELFMTSYEMAVRHHDLTTAQLMAGVMVELGMIEDETVLESAEKEIRRPDWDRVIEMGEHPRWVLETNRGVIVILLDPFSAPFTVSSIDSLTRSGLYDGVAFHRVVRNFVIQGGDFDRLDGLGGPDYRIPTEPAFDTFKRGSVGMASSGRDTEGSQFFITHTWTPHLDGLYTIFGEVIEGMDVVDRIQIGDMVLSAEIENKAEGRTQRAEE